MSLQMQPDQLLGVLENMGHKDFEFFKERLLALSNAMADVIVNTIPGLDRGDATWEYSMMCVPIRSDGTSTKIPVPLQGFDDEGWE